MIICQNKAEMGRSGVWGREGDRSFEQTVRGEFPESSSQSEPWRPLQRGAPQAAVVANTEAPVGRRRPTLFEGQQGCQHRLRALRWEGGSQGGHCKAFRFYFEWDGQPLEALSRGATWSHVQSKERLRARWGRDELWGK